MSDTFTNKGFSEFLQKGLEMPMHKIREFKATVLKDNPEISENQLRTDMYNELLNGIPVYRLNAYCMALNISPDTYFRYCRDQKPKPSTYVVSN